MAIPTTSIEAFNTRQLATAGITNIVSTRVWANLPTEDQPWPYTVSWVVSGGDGLRLDGRNILQDYQIQCDCYGRTEGEAAALLNAVIAMTVGWVDVPNLVKGCFPMGARNETVNEDGSQINSETFRLFFMG